MGLRHSVVAGPNRIGGDHPVLDGEHHDRVPDRLGGGVHDPDPDRIREQGSGEPLLSIAAHDLQLGRRALHRERQFVSGTARQQYAEPEGKDPIRMHTSQARGSAAALRSSGHKPPRDRVVVAGGTLA